MPETAGANFQSIYRLLHNISKLNPEALREIINLVSKEFSGIRDELNSDIVLNEGDNPELVRFRHLHIRRTLLTKANSVIYRTIIDLYEDDVFKYLSGIFPAPLNSLSESDSMLLECLFKYYGESVLKVKTFKDMMFRLETTGLPYDPSRLIPTKTEKFREKNKTEVCEKLHDFNKVDNLLFHEQFNKDNFEKYIAVINSLSQLIAHKSG